MSNDSWRNKEQDIFLVTVDVNNVERVDSFEFRSETFSASSPAKMRIDVKCFSACPHQGTSPKTLAGPQLKFFCRCRGGRSSYIASCLLFRMALFRSKRLDTICLSLPLYLSCCAKFEIICHNNDLVSNITRQQDSQANP